MDNPWDAVASAMQQARDARKAVDNYANQMASLLVDSLRAVDKDRLRVLKRALHQFDATTGKWKRPR